MPGRFGWNRRRFLGAMFLGGAAACRLAPAAAQALPARRFAVGAPLVDFCAINAEKRLVSTADWRGQVVFMHWFGSWCPPCRKEIPELAELQKQFDGRTDVHFLFLNGLERVERTRKWLASIDVNVSLYDSSNTSRQDQFISLLTGERRHCYSDMGLALYPSSWLIDKRGVIKRAWSSEQRGWANWGKAFLEDLAKEDVPAPGVRDVDWLAGEWKGQLEGYGERAMTVEKAGGGLRAQWVGADGRKSPLRIVWGNAGEALVEDPESWKAGGNGVRLLAKPSGELAGTFMLAKDQKLVRVALKRTAA